MRGLTKEFLVTLKKGILVPVLEHVKQDKTLSLEIRKNYFNIYYRGGNILKVDWNKGILHTYWDSGYVHDHEESQVPKELPSEIKKQSEAIAWVNAIPILKYEMDVWFCKHPKDEREFQQLIVRENNYSKAAKGTDYFICDIEYANPHGRFDMIGVRWPSSGSERKRNTNLGLAFIEMKYCDNALTGSAGMAKHLRNMNKFLEDPKKLDDLKGEMKEIFNQKQDLDLIINQHKIRNFSTNKPEYIFILTNHDPDSKILYDELEKLPELLKDLNFEEKINLRFAVSNFTGYGLYKENIYSLNEFKERFSKQIYSKSNS